MHELQSVTERKNSRRTRRLTAGDTVTERTELQLVELERLEEAEFQERILGCFFTMVGSQWRWRGGRCTYGRGSWKEARPVLHI